MHVFMWHLLMGVAGWSEFCTRSHHVKHQVLCLIMVHPRSARFDALFYEISHVRYIHDSTRQCSLRVLPVRRHISKAARLQELRDAFNGLAKRVEGMRKIKVDIFALVWRCMAASDEV